MTKTRKTVYFSKTFFILGLLLAPFFVSASTFYQQLTDSSGFIVTSSAGTLIGSFDTTSTTTITFGSDIGFAVYNFKTLNLISGITLSVNSASNCGGQYATYTSRLYSADETNTDVDYFVDLIVDSPGTVSLPPGTHYVCFKGWSNNADVLGQLRMNLSNDFFYGYLTGAGTHESIPIAPGLPGFSDAGIATSSQQVYCYQNFSTSTGLLDSVGASISLGVCNVGVFLFIPSTASVATFTSNRDMLLSKAPLSWITQARAILQGYSATSTETFINLALPFGSTTAAIGLSTVDVISTTTLSKYLSTGTREAAKGLIGSLFYLLAISFIYRDLQRLWHKQV